MRLQRPVRLLTLPAREIRCLIERGSSLQEYVWKELPADAEYMLIRPSTPADTLTVQVEGEIAGDLAERLEASIGVPAKVESVPEGTFPRASYKSVRVLDED